MPPKLNRVWSDNQRTKVVFRVYSWKNNVSSAEYWSMRVAQHFNHDAVYINDHNHLYLPVDNLTNTHRGQSYNVTPCTLPRVSPVIRNTAVRCASDLKVIVNGERNSLIC